MTHSKTYIITYLIEEGEDNFVMKESEVRATSIGLAWREFFRNHRGAEPSSIREVEPSDFSHSTMED